MEVFYTNTIIEQNEELIEKTNENKSLITFAKFNKFFLIPILLAIFNFLSDLLEFIIDQSKVIKNPEVVKSIFYDISNVFAGFFYFIPYLQVNVNIKKKLTNKEKSDIVSNYIYKKSLGNIINTKKDIIIIILLCLMLSIDDLLWVLIGEFKDVFEEKLFYLFFIPLFSKIILKEDIYKHQYFSLLISLIGIILIIIPFFLDSTPLDILPNILNFIKGINYSLFLVLIKYVVEKFYFPPLKISLIIGLITIIINLIGYTIYCLIINDFSLFTDCFDFSQVENKLAVSINLILYILFLTASQLALYLSIFYFSPTLITVTDIISPLFMWIISNFDEEAEIIEEILCPIGYLTTIFSTLIYNELIIFNCCGLNKNTKKFVNKRITKEIREIQKSEEILQLEIGEDSLMNDNN